MAIGIDFFNFLTKILTNKRATSSAKATYEEIGDFTINIHKDEMWNQTIDLDPIVAENQGVIQKHTLQPFTEDITVASQRAWYMEIDSERVKDWVSDKYGSNYGIKLFDADDNEIFSTDASSWFFNYPTGVLTFENSVSGFSQPFKLTGYRYIGTKGADGYFDSLTLSFEIICFFVVKADPIILFRIFLVNFLPENQSRRKRIP